MVAKMRKDVLMGFRLPRVIREHLERVARRDMRTASQYLVKVLVEHLIAIGELRAEEGFAAVTRARPSPPKRRKLDPAPQGGRRRRTPADLSRGRLPRDEAADGTRRRR